MSDRDCLVSVQSQLATIQSQIAVQLGTPVPKPDPIPPTPVPTPPGVVMHPILGPSGQGNNLTSQLGVIQCFPLPAKSAVTLTSTALPGTPQELKLEWFISTVKGDATYAMTPAASVSGRGGVVYHPCIASGGVESGGLKWGPTAAMDVCKVPGPLYLNMRFVSGVPPNTDFTITYSWW